MNTKQLAPNLRVHLATMDVPTQDFTMESLVTVVASPPHPITMSDTPHIKRFEECGRYYDQDGFEFIVERMLNDLAEHVERLEKRLESHFHYQQQNSDVAERNNYEQLESTGIPTTGPDISSHQPQ